MTSRALSWICALCFLARAGIGPSWAQEAPTTDAAGNPVGTGAAFGAEATPRESGKPPASGLFGGGTGLQASLAVDGVGKTGEANPGASDRFDIREAELMLFAPADHLFDGMLSLAAHQEGGVALFEVHEAFVGSSKLIPRSRFRIGQFFLPIGRLNQFHRHDWPFITAPRVQAEFFDREGLIDTGVDFSYLTPLPFFLELTAGVANGWTFGHAHNEGQKPAFPTHSLRTATYLPLPWNGGSQLGLNYLGRRAADGTFSTFLGLDLTAKWRESANLRFLLQSEVWYRRLSPRGAEPEGTLGLYVYPQYGFDPRLQAGVRLDYYSSLSLRDIAGRKIGNGIYAIVPTLTYRTSEFVTFRGAYTHEWVTQDQTPTSTNSSVEVQAVLILGVHPAHDF